MLPLSAAQAALAKRPHVQKAALVELTTYTNYAAGTVQSRWYWSNVSRRALWGGTARQFDGVLLPGRDGVGTYRTTLGELTASLFRLTVRNEDGLWSDLRGDNLSGARVVVAERYLEPGTVHLDDEDHHVVYRGKVQGAEEEDGEIELEFGQETPGLDLREVLDETKADPRHFGAIWPYPVGQFRDVPCVGIEVGSLTTLGTPINATDTPLVLLKDASKLPTGPTFDLWIEGEELTAFRLSETAIKIESRGQSGTKATVHPAGATVIELVDVELGVSGWPIEALDGLAVRNPNTGLLIPLGGGWVTTNTIANGCTVTIPQDTLREVFASTQVSAAVTQQPEYIAEDSTP